MSKLYRVIDNTIVDRHGVEVGDFCTLINSDDDGSAWFENSAWAGDGVLCILWNMVEEVK